MSYSHLPKKLPILIKDHFDPNQDCKILHVAVSACMCVCVFMCMCVCLCACLCLHEEGLQEHYAEEDFEGAKISIFEDIHFTRR